VKHDAVLELDAGQREPRDTPQGHVSIDGSVRVIVIPLPARMRCGSRGARRANRLRPLFRASLRE